MDRDTPPGQRLARGKRSTHPLTGPPISQTGGQVCAMSALAPKADIVEHDRYVRFVPKGDIQELRAPVGGPSQTEYGKLLLRCQRKRLILPS